MRYWILPVLLLSTVVFAHNTTALANSATEVADTPDLATTPEQTVATLWRALSHEPGVAADVTSLKTIFHPDAVVFGATYKDGQPQLSQRKATDFLQKMAEAKPKGFYECEVSRQLVQHDLFATVYSVVESRADKNAKAADFVGVNSIQLYKADAGWQILSLYYHVSRPELPLPLGTGKSGHCLP